MYRRSKRGPGCIVLVVVLGMVLGAIYFFRDQTPPPLQSDVILLPTSTPSPVPTRVVELPTPLPVPTESSPVTLIIPTANVAAPIVRVFLGEGGSWNVSGLGFNAGHLNGTAWLDQPGNIVLAGHVEMSDGSPGIFAHLTNLKAGDEVLLTASTERRVYRVDSLGQVAPDDLRALYPTSNDQLTLITCGDYDFATNAYLVRIVVRTTRIS